MLLHAWEGSRELRGGSECQSQTPAPRLPSSNSSGEILFSSGSPQMQKVCRLILCIASDTCLLARPWWWHAEPLFKKCNVLDWEKENLRGLLPQRVFFFRSFRSKVQNSRTTCQTISWEIGSGVKVLKKRQMDKAALYQTVKVEGGEVPFFTWGLLFSGAAGAQKITWGRKTPSPLMD